MKRVLMLSLVALFLAAPAYGRDRNDEIQAPLERQDEIQAPVSQGEPQAPRTGGDQLVK